MARTLKVDIVTDSRGIGKGIDEANSKFGKLGGLAKGAGIAVGAGLAVAGAAAVKFGASSISAASDVQQSFGALESVYGKNAEQVKAWATAAATAVGLSKNEYANLAAVVGAQLQGMGVSTAASATKSRDLIKVGADLSATFGGSVSDAVSAVSSLLKGEADPIERYGVSIKQSDVQARLAALGLDKLKGSALKQAQAQATLTLLMDKTKSSVGAFGRESDTLAHKQQVLGAKFENIKATIGQALLPVMTTFLGFIGDTVLPLLGRLAPVVDTIHDAFLGLFFGFNEGDVTSDGLFGKFEAIGKTLRENLLPAVKDVLRGLQSFVGFIVKDVVPKVLAFYATIAKSLLPVVRDLAAFFTRTLLPAFKAVIRFVVDVVVPGLAKALKPVIEGIGKAVRNVTEKVNEHKESFQKLWQGLKPVIAFLAEKVAPVVGKVVGTAFQAMGTSIGLVIDIIASLIEFVDKAIKKITELVDKVKNSKVGEIVGKVGGAVGKLNPFDRVLVSGAGSEAAAGPVINNFNILGAIDPVGTARTIEAVQRGQAVRMGRVPRIA